MLGGELSGGEVTIETTASEPNDGVVSFIGIAGSWAVPEALTCSPQWPAASVRQCHDRGFVRR
jgi:hypothetical protein